MTLNQLIILFKDIAARHEQVNDFAAVQDFNIDADNAPIYPILVVNPTGANLPRTENGYSSFTTTFDLQVIDLTNKDNNNELEVLSDTQQILNDVVNEFNTHPYYLDAGIDTVGDITFAPLRGVYDSDVDGWKVSIELEHPNKLSFCGNPIENLSGFDFSPASVTVIDGVDTIELFPSSTYTCVSGGVNPSGIAYQRPKLTGQVTSYATNDDADNLAKGVYDYTPPVYPISHALLDTAHATPFLMITDNNAFGNKYRFTDSVGTQLYDGTGGSIANYVIDHLTGLGWFAEETTSLNWATALTTATASTKSGFSDWRIPNIEELYSIANYENTARPFEYEPFITAGANPPSGWLQFWTSNTRSNVTTSAYWYQASEARLLHAAKTGTIQTIICRNHY